MMIHQTAEKLRNMRLPAMAAEYIRQSELPSMSALDFDERVGMMTDAEWLSRDNNRVKRLTKEAMLRYPDACFADIDFRPSRRLDRAYIARLTDFAWAKESRNIILTGSTGTGKTWLACAFGAQACRIGLRVRFYRVNKLLSEIAVAAGTGCADKFLDKLNKCDILILDDWGLSALTLLEGKFLHEVFENRCGEKSTIISAQLPVSEWHGLFEDGTVADAVLDRIVHNSYRLELQGPTMRLAANRGVTGYGGGGENGA